MHAGMDLWERRFFAPGFDPLSSENEAGQLKQKIGRIFNFFPAKFNIRLQISW